MASPQATIKKASAMMQSGRLRDADKLYRKVLKQDPNNVTALYNCGVIAHKSGRLQESQQRFRQASQLARDFPEAFMSLASVQFDLGLHNAAIDNFRQALRLNPRLERAHFRLGNLLESQREPEQAAAHYRHSLALQPSAWDSHLGLGRTLCSIEHYADALAQLRTARRLAPDQDEIWRTTGECLKQMAFTDTGADAERQQELRTLLTRKLVEPNSLIGPVMSALRTDPALAPLLALSATPLEQSDSPLHAALAEGRPLPGMNHPLLVLALQSLSLCDLPLERALTRLRCLLLENVDALSAKPSTYLDLLCALAWACFQNEYVFCETAHEAAAVDTLHDGIEHSTNPSESLLALLACYRPLHRTAFADTLITRDWSEPMAALIDLQVTAPLHERTLTDSIERLTEIDDQVSLNVRRQYEQNPYPRWHFHHWSSPAAPVRQVIEQLFPHTQNISLPNPKRPNILVAGCGTGRHAFKVAGRFCNARVLAIDLSRSSLAYATRMAAKHGVDSIRFCQGDILKLAELEQRFDLIESCGVLHHMQDPTTAWQILTDLLHPGGLMKIALYSEHARQNVVAARQQLAEHADGEQIKDIRRFRQTLLDGKAPSTLQTLTNFTDFFSTSECRDLVFHVQEHRFTLPQVEQIIDRLGLAFLGFEFTDNQWHERYRRRFVEDKQQTSLANWHLFEQENADLFAGMYQMWFIKKEAA